MQATNIEDNIPLYITKESTKKRKPTDLNSDQKWIQNQTQKCQVGCIIWLVQSQSLT